ncbi:uncharacterized protein LOC127374401 isoform X2 [Dicentrarchus labrax]|uniref:uncharacterized protein LOC127374401 isoform X2 n=1 Tax=Dicentrarchus labrax TaxID=13489 RepID=UPI0021F62F1A|nr:uncharacterized protein LOC127374401 isoform X2 [Dicentrarchus labrax]
MRSADRRRYTRDSGLCFQPRHVMMLLLLLLGACFCVGISYDEEDYGATLRIRLSRKAVSLEFTQMYGSDVTILWKRDDPPAQEDQRRKEMGSYFVIYNSTQRDSGSYRTKDKHGLILSRTNIRVVAIKKLYELKPDNVIKFPLELNSCNIRFFQEYDERGTEIVKHGRQLDFYDSECTGWEMIKPCSLGIKYAQKACSGRYLGVDQNGHTALEATLEEESSFDTSPIGIGLGIFFIVTGCCGCLKHCCCGKSSSKSDEPETPDEEPAVQPRQYDHKPVGPSREPLSPPAETHYPAHPSYTPTGPLIHNPPAVDAPPSYSEIHNPPAVDVPPPSYSEVPAPTVPFLSEPGDRFELKGKAFSSSSSSSSAPLSSDSPTCYVYTSDKLNFL